MDRVNIDLPPYVALALGRLNGAGYEAVVVGGCVRDSLLGAPLHDFDIAASASPDETAAVFADFNVVGTGIKHGTVTVVLEYDGEKRPLEITTYRVDGEYTDRRRPDTVAFTGELSEDLRRRDFTVNAMAYSEKTGLVDLFDGRGDLSRRLIRCVGEPDRRFGEDGLRILRALRFASVLGFDIERETAASVHKNRELLGAVSAERIYSEFTKLLLGGGAGGIISEYADVVAVFAPDAAFERAPSLDAAPPDAAARFAILFYDDEYTGNTARAALGRLKADKRTVTDTAAIIGLMKKRCLTDGKEPDTAAIKKAMSERGAELFGRFIRTARALKIDGADGIEREYARIISSGECFSRASLAVNGRDLLDAGIGGGGTLGRVLDGLLDGVIDGAYANERAELLNAAKRLYGDG